MCNVTDPCYGTRSIPCSLLLGIPQGNPPCLHSIGWPIECYASSDRWRTSPQSLLIFLLEWDYSNRKNKQRYPIKRGNPDMGKHVRHWPDPVTRQSHSVMAGSMSCLLLLQGSWFMADNSRFSQPSRTRPTEGRLCQRNQSRLHSTWVLLYRFRLKCVKFCYSRSDSSLADCSFVLFVRKSSFLSSKLDKPLRDFDLFIYFLSHVNIFWGHLDLDGLSLKETSFLINGLKYACSSAKSGYQPLLIEMHKLLQISETNVVWTCFTLIFYLKKYVETIHIFTTYLNLVYFENF